MKNRIRYGIAALLIVLISCEPQDNDDHSLGTPDTITADQVSFRYSKSPTNNNIVTFVNTTQSKVPMALKWDLGNGTITKERNPTGEYPYAGDYTIKLTVYTSDGTEVTVSQSLSIEKNDFTLLNVPKYRSLGGNDNNSVRKRLRI